ncbi:MAG: hypothetical protein JNM70_18025 [Anaerolineae bacterium]|nr:hypothetical protein [Anaerolineae bacterium]
MNAATVSPEDIQAATRELAEKLQETEEKPLRQIAMIFEHCGAEFAQAVYEETLQIEANGGMMLPDQSRRRTVGGVYFYLARGKMEPEMVKLIFPGYRVPRKADEEIDPSVAALPSFEWGERIGIIESLSAEAGELNTVKVTLVGRPGRVELRKEVAITTMNYTVKLPTLPKGVPTPPSTPTLYTVYIGLKQWKRVEEAIANPEDALVIEGTAAYDPEVKGMAVYATSITTKMLDAVRRQQQKDSQAQAAQPASEGSAPTPAPTAPAPAEKKAAAPRTKSAPGIPEEVKQKLSELYASASLFRQKIANLQGKPAGQQFGMEMTQKLLKNVEEEIAALEKKYSGGN